MSFAHIPLGRFDKEEALLEAVEIVGKFLRLNEISPPRILRKRLSTKGDYRAGVIRIDLGSTVSPVKTPGFSWSFPGNRSDITVYGVLAHETGHYVSDTHRWFRPKWKHGHREPGVSSYGRPNGEEGLAEAIRLFILNPDLLRVGRPQMFSLLRVTLGLKPLHNDEWENVLAFAHDRIIAANKVWIKRGKKS